MKAKDITNIRKLLTPKGKKITEIDKVEVEQYKGRLREMMATGIERNAAANKRYADGLLTGGFVSAFANMYVGGGLIASGVGFHIYGKVLERSAMYVNEHRKLKMSIVDTDIALLEKYDNSIGKMTKLLNDLPRGEAFRDSLLQQYKYWTREIVYSLLEKRGISPSKVRNSDLDCKGNGELELNFCNNVSSYSAKQVEADLAKLELASLNKTLLKMNVLIEGKSIEERANPIIEPKAI